VAAIDIGAFQKGDLKNMCGTEDLVELFFNDTALVNIIVHFCNNVHDEGIEAISDILFTMLKSPLQVAFTATGMLPFRQNSTLIVPYNGMNDVQLAFCESIISAPCSHMKLAKQIIGTHVLLVYYQGKFVVYSYIFVVCSYIYTLYYV
jgi:hypothetical protein